MSEKKEIEIWGRPLEKMTTKDLKEAALQAGGIFGVHGMKRKIWWTPCARPSPLRRRP